MYKFVYQIPLLSEEWRVGYCLRTGLEEGRVDTITDCALVVVVLVAELVTDRVVVERADTMANYFLAVFAFLSLRHNRKVFLEHLDPPFLLQFASSQISLDMLSLTQKISRQ